MMRNFFLQLLIIKFCSIVLLTFSELALANSETCSALPMHDSSGYLENNTAYGYVKNRLYMQSYIDGACADATDELRFCIQNQEGFSDYCREVKLALGRYSSLDQLNPNSEFAANPSLRNIIVEVREIGNDLCLLMPTSQGTTPLLCRANNLISGNPPVEEPEEEVPTICRNISEVCYADTSHTQSLISFSGIAVQCIKETLDRVFFVGTECPASDQEIAYSMLTPFPEFQNAMRLAVGTALTIYVIAYGFSLIMDSSNGSKEKIITFILKLILVAYFAVGIGNSTIIDGKEVRPNGMTGFALPFLVAMTNNFTEMAFLAGGSQGLCDFDASKYDAGYEYYKIWDAIDCRVGYYLGLQLLYNIGDVLASAGTPAAAGNTASGKAVINENQQSSMAVSNLSKPGEIAFIPVMFGFFLGGQLIIVILGVFFVIFFISVLAFFVSLYIACLVTLYAMAYISPIFITMALFDRTKSYFDGWLRVVVSCTLQPAVVGCFIAILLTVYDSTIYENCEFQRYDYEIGEHAFSTFALHEPLIEPELCRESLGYKLLRYYFGDEGWDVRSYILFQVTYLSDYLGLAMSLIYVMIYVFIFYFFMKSTAEFAAEITGGPQMGAITIAPDIVLQKTKGAAVAAIALAKSAMKMAKGDLEGAKKERVKAKDKLFKEGISEPAKDEDPSLESVGDAAAGGDGAGDLVSGGGDEK